MCLYSMSADSRRRSRVVFILFPQARPQFLHSLSHPHMWRLPPPRRAFRRLKKFISFGSTRGLWVDWLEFEYWFHSRGPTFVTSFLDARSYNLLPHFLPAGTGGG